LTVLEAQTEAGTDVTMIQTDVEMIPILQTRNMIGNVEIVAQVLTGADTHRLRLTIIGTRVRMRRNLHQRRIVKRKRK